MGLDEFITKIEKENWMDFDVVVATPNVMAKLGKIARILGPRNLMPNPKTGTVTNDVANAVNEVKGGKIAFKIDKAGIIHAGIGKVSFDEGKLVENARALADAIQRAKPTGAKGTYVKKVSLSSTMGPGVRVDVSSLSVG